MSLRYDGCPVCADIGFCNDHPMPRMTPSRIEQAGAVDQRPTLHLPPRKAIFPLTEGDVVLTYPARLSDQGYSELAEYIAVFLRQHSAIIRAGGKE